MTLLAPPRDAWYIAAASSEVARRPVSRTIFDEPIVLFRDEDDRAVALVDRCLHRNMQLSAGRVVGGCLECPYHGWRYDGAGRCVAIPSLDPSVRVALPEIPRYPTAEGDGYVWVWMGRDEPGEPPRRFPHLRERGWTTFSMTTRFPAGAFACLENFLDCPHTVFVHRGWFRTRDPRQVRARVQRHHDRVVAEFVDERPARSVVRTLFFPAGTPLCHTDQFVLPATSRVDYAFGTDRHFIITSECTPVSEHETLVYTVITFRYRRLGALVRLVFQPMARFIIRQDVAILGLQTSQLRRFGGARFTTVETDLFARGIRALWTAAADGRSASPISDDVAIRF